MFLKKVKKSHVVREKMKSVAKKKPSSVSLATILPNANKHYVVGDLVWVKVGSHPFWPSMVTYDPLTGDFRRDQPIGKNGKTRIVYHVQYFGKAAMRGWTVAQRMFPFEGKEKFKAMEQSALHKVKKKTGTYKKIEKLFRVSARAKQLWNEAIDEALKAFAIEDLNDRLEANVFNYYVPSGALKRAKELNVDLNTNERQVKRCLRNENSDEPYCKICKRDEPDFACTGYCNKAFHKDCLGLLCVPQGFKCPDCDLEEHSCFVCKSPDGDFIKCSLSKCGRSYHEYCLSRYHCGNKEKNICPRHTCLTCYNENPKNVMARKGTMLQCTECPTAYHSYHTCIAAGSKMVGPNKLVCPDHFFGKHKSLNEQRKIQRKHESSKKKRKTAIKQKPSNEQRKSQTINVLYCCICCLGGELVCCETCPNAYHKSCLNVEVSEGDFFCEDCMKRKHLTYGAIIWGKTGKYRWWPGKIMHPDNIPQNVQKIKHLDGDFPVLYFGTGEYDWLHRGRVIPYAEHHKEMTPEGSSAVNTLKIKFKKSLKEASEAYDEYQLLRASENNMSEEPEEYKPLKVNKAVPPAQIVPLDVTSSSSPCLCDPSMDNPCGPESSCLNLSLLMECHSGICNADDRCKNRRFQKRQYASLKRIKTRNRGWGLITCQEIKKGDFVIEYVGEVITYKEYRKRAEMLQAQGKSNFYFLQLDATRIIDAGPCGNAARFINHSCDPNCEMVKWSVNGDVRIGIFALYDIASGEELTFNYECDTSCQQKCFCGSANCSGIIGRNLSSVLKVTKPPSENKKHVANKVPIRSKSKRKPEAYEREENHCFICKCPGSLILCDKEGCIRAYHIRCLGLSKVPEGDWMCPWHFCSSCPMEAYRFCSDCPVSYCRKHLPSGLTIRGKSFQCRHCQRSRQPCPSSGSSESPNSLAALVSESSSAPSLNQYPGEELTFNHEYDTSCQQKYFCVNSHFSGIIGRNLSLVSKMTKPPSENKKHVANKVPIRSKSKRKIETYEQEENHCFICKNPGSLILCDKEGCIRAYHIRCLGLSKVPEGDWMCPLHLCSSCPLEAYCFCSNCPVSYCRKHLPPGLTMRGKLFQCRNCQRLRQPCPSSGPSESPNSLAALIRKRSSARSLNQSPGEKLTYNYECNTLTSEKGFSSSANCSGMNGENSVLEVTKQPSEDMRHVANKVSTEIKSNEVIETDCCYHFEPEVCFICKKPGYLICCQQIMCLKNYHLDCVGLTTHPAGSWECSRHFCGTCKREAYSHCSNCLNSYCQDHLPSDLEGRSFLCSNCQNPQQLCPSSEGPNSVAALVSQSSSDKDGAGESLEKGQ